MVLYDYGAEGGLYYIVYELLDGRALSEELRRGGPMAAERAAHIAAQVLRSLAEAHELGIVHRDIKPANVFLAEFPGEQDVVKVLDFGIAKDLSKKEATQLTQTGYTLGTPRYMAPEQLLGRQADPASDLYALGLVMAEMLDGKPVFPDGTLSCVEQKLRKASTPLPAGVRSSPLATIVQRATEPDPQRRYGTALEMLADLATVAHTLPSLPAPLPETLEHGPVQTVPMDLAGRTIPQQPVPSDRLAATWSEPPPPPLLISQPPGASVPEPPRRRPSSARPSAVVWIAVSLVSALLLLGLGGWVAATVFRQPEPHPDRSSNGEKRFVSEAEANPPPTAATPGQTAASATTSPSAPRPAAHELKPVDEPSPPSPSPQPARPVPARPQPASDPPTWGF